MYEQIGTFREPVSVSWFVSVLLLIWIIEPLYIFLKSHLVCSDPHKFAIDVQWTKWWALTGPFVKPPFLSQEL